MTNIPDTFVDDDDCVYTAELIPARVVIRRQASPKAEPSIVGTIFGDTENSLSSEHALVHGAGPWAKDKARELLGLPTRAEMRAKALA